MSAEYLSGLPGQHRLHPQQLAQAVDVPREREGPDISAEAAEQLDRARLRAPRREPERRPLVHAVQAVDLRTPLDEERGDVRRRRCTPPRAAGAVCCNGGPRRSGDRPRSNRSATTSARSRWAAANITAGEQSSSGCSSRIAFALSRSRWRQAAANASSPRAPRSPAWHRNGPASRRSRCRPCHRFLVQGARRLVPARRRSGSGLAPCARIHSASTRSFSPPPDGAGTGRRHRSRPYRASTSWDRPRRPGGPASSMARGSARGTRARRRESACCRIT